MKQQKLPKEWSLKEGDLIQNKKIKKVDFFEDKCNCNHTKLLTLEDDSNYLLDNQGLRPLDNSAEYKEHLQRLQADFENYIKRTNAERESYKELIEAQVILKFLPIIDDLERIKSEDQKLNEGIKMLQKNIVKILNSYQVAAFDSLGQEPDPTKHHVLETVKGEKDNIIVEELQKGYILNNSILRPALVKVSKNVNENHFKEEY